MLDWLIIGGGIHGTYLSLYLTQRKGLTPAQVRVVDPFPQSLTLWHHFTRNTGMLYLRSSHAHNLHFDPFSLITFSRTRGGQPLADFIEPYGRPSLKLFNVHSQRLIERYHLEALRMVGRAEKLRQIEGGWQVDTDAGSVGTHNVILAFGNTEAPHWPVWAKSLQATGGSIHHLFDPAYERMPPQGETVVVGGGISSAQVAVALAVEAPGMVTLLTRHLPRVHQFDADIGWITHQYLDAYHQEMDTARRRTMIQAARHRGSMPADVARELDQAVQQGLLNLRIDEVAEAANGDRINLSLVSGERIETDHVLLATGFEPARPGGTWITTAVNDYGLPCAADGYPIVDKRLCWSAGLYVSGSLAELEIGPVARNFVGVKLAAERIGESL